MRWTTHCLSYIVQINFLFFIIISIMHNFAPLAPLDNWIVLSSLFIILGIGIISGLKINTVREYTIGNRGAFSTSTLAMALIARMIGGMVTIGAATEFFKHGYIFTLAVLGHIIGMLILAKFVAAKFDDRFKGALSSPDIIGKFYGLTSERFAGVASILSGICSAGIQITALAFILSSFLNLNYQFCVLISGSIMIAYSAFGGIKSVTTTDVIQFLLIAIGIPILANLTLQKVGNLDSILPALSQEQTQIFNHKNFDMYSMLFLSYLLPATWLYPHTVQRYLMTKNSQQAVKITYLYVFTVISVFFMMACLAFASIKLFPNISPNLVFMNAVDNVLPIGFKRYCYSRNDSNPYVFSRFYIKYHQYNTNTQYFFF